MTSNRIHSRVVILVCVLAFMACSSKENPENLGSGLRATVLLSKTRQTIEGFGASDGWAIEQIGSNWSRASLERVADLLFSTSDGIGLSAWRFYLGGGPNQFIVSSWREVESFEVAEGAYDWSRRAGQQWFLQAAWDRGVRNLTAFAVSPPVRLTRNGLTHCSPNEDSTNLKAGAEDDYARYLVDVLEHFKTEEEVTFSRVSPINEPQWDWIASDQEGNRASNGDIKRIVAALYNELKARAMETQIDAPESGDLPGLYELNDIKYGEKLYGDYVDALMGDAEFREMVGSTITGHSQWSDILETELVQHRQKLKKKLDEYPGVAYRMTMYSVLETSQGKNGNGRDYGIETALQVARVIHYDLTIGQAISWYWWASVSAADWKDGLLYTDWSTLGDDESLSLTKTFWALGHYSRFVRPGYKRVHVEGAGIDDKTGLMVSAFWDDSSRSVVVVALNVSSQAIPFIVDVASVDTDSDAAWEFERYLTSDAPGDDLRATGAIQSGTSTEIPARSIVTLVSQ